ncbi:hypothetical protein B7494_g1408 [Chlorociboria aeruginascens]|nr:hypothetical protein B7494_g1408 [Chlorociboria aeruginascens]
MALISTELLCTSRRKPNPSWPMRIEHNQPRLIPPPSFEPQERQSRSREWVVARSRSFASRASSRGSFSVRRKQSTQYSKLRRPQIGAPSDFRHVENGLSRRPEGFRKLELSIYMPENQLSPILPHFGAVDDTTFPYQNEPLYPPSIYAQSRSESSLSFQIPRKPIRSSTASTSDLVRPRPGSLSVDELLNALEGDIPRRPPQARLRSYTEPPAYDRVKSALHERFELEQKLREIDIIIEERQSVYFSSRPTSRAPSRAASRSESRPRVYEESQEPLPTPPLNPSFTQRMSSSVADQRPKTAPSQTVYIPARLTPFNQATATFNKPPLPLKERSFAAPPPPLPLVLTAPPQSLRKKKSFSRVSSWLFPSPMSASSSPQDHTRTLSMDSITNAPKNITSREGFYQCIDLNSHTPTHRRSGDSFVSTVSSLSHNDDVDSKLDAQTLVGTWTPNSSPGREKREKSVELTRIRTFGEPDIEAKELWRVEELPLPTGHGRNSVGVAF